MARANLITRPCEACGAAFQAKAADIARGWGRFCSKSCKAKKTNGGSTVNERTELASLAKRLESGLEYSGEIQLREAMTEVAIALRAIAQKTVLAEPFAYVDCNGNKTTSLAELAFPRQVRKGPRGAKAAWRELQPGLHPLYLEAPQPADHIPICADAVQGIAGEVVEIGDDQTGQSRILIHTTRDAIKAHAGNLLFKPVHVTAVPGQSEAPP